MSAFDFVKDPAGQNRVVSCKSKDAKDRDIAAVRPSSANVAQERRMLALDGRAAGDEFEIWMVDPGTLAAAGPYVYELRQEDIDEALLEVGRVDKAWRHFTAMEEPVESDEWNDPEAWRRLFGLRSTSGAFRYPTLDADVAIEARVNAFTKTRKALAKAEFEAEQAKKLIRPHVEEQIALARRANPDAKRITAHGADGVIVEFQLTSNGQMRVSEKPKPAADDAAA